MIISDPFILVIGAFLVLFVLLALGFKIAIALAMVAVLGFFVYQGSHGLTPFVPFHCLNSFVLTAIPLFIFMGGILVECGASDMIYRGTSKLLAWAPGGLFHSNIGACALFAAISGSSPATAATIGTIAIPELKRRNYDTNIVLGSLAAGGTLGILIPPSINLIVYGVVVEESVGQLFAGGVIPGIILAGMFMVYIGFRAVRNPRLAPKEVALSLKALPLALMDLWPFFVLLVIVLGGIFGGIMTPTEAAAVGSFASLVIALTLRRLSWQLLRSSLVSTLETSCMVLFIILGASLLASFFARAGIPAAVAASVVGAGLSKWIILLCIYVAYIFLGCFIDPLSIIVMTAATVLPIVVQLGFDPIWFGIAYVLTAETGMITPPMGLNLFVIQGISREDLGKVVVGSFPFFLIMLVALALVTAFPSIVLWFPNLLFGS